MRETYVVTAPTEEPLSLDQVKNHLRVDVGEDDVWLMGAIRAARERAEAVTGRALVTRTVEVTRDGWPAGPVWVLPHPPLQSVTSIKYTDVAGVEATFDAANYLVDARSTPGRIVLKTAAGWPSAVLREVNGVVVRYVAGYGLRGAVPREIVEGMLLAVGEMYENRENAPGAGVGVAERMWLKHRVFFSW